MSDDRYERGWARLEELAGRQGTRVVEGLHEVAPDLARYVVELGYGQVYSRGRLDDRTRQPVAVSALAALGGADAQLEYHIAVALNVGVTPQEIVDTVTHLAPFVGVPRALNAARAAKQVFAAGGSVSEEASPTPPGRLPAASLTGGTRPGRRPSWSPGPAPRSIGGRPRPQPWCPRRRCRP